MTKPETDRKKRKGKKGRELDKTQDPPLGEDEAPGAATAHARAGARHAVTDEAAASRQENVNIFNFTAWFKADPVKAALTLGLAFLSWLATYTGMLELIQANTGSLEIGPQIAIGFAVLMLMLMILYLLDSLYSGATPNWLKPVFIFGYLFLTLISVGFGFGFYWKYLEAQTEATRSAESAVSQVQVSLQLGQTRLEQLQNTFTQLAVLSKKKAEQEREKGNTCPNSRPGEGPRMRLRDEDSQKFGYAAEYITGRADTVKTDLNALNGDLKKVVTKDPSTVGGDGTRNEFMRALGRKLDLTIARFNALATDPQIKQFRDSMDKRAGTTVFPNGRGGTFRCPDTQLQTALRGVVRAIDDIPEIKNPKVAAVEGSEAIVEAFRRLAVTVAALPTLKLPPSPEELRKQRKQVLSSGKANAEVSNIQPGLSKRDYIPLSAAIFVDLCILLISLNRRYNNFEKFHRSVASAEAGAIGNTMLEIFDAHQNEFSQEMLEIFHHAEFEYGSDYYMAVPLIKGSKQALRHERLIEKDRSIIRSKHETLQERINVYELELQRRLADQMETERTSRQINDFISGLGNRRQKLLQAQRQLMDLSRQHPGEAIVLDKVQKVSGDIGSIDTQLVEFTKKQEAIKRLQSGTNTLVQETRKEISNLKHKQTLLHEEEKGFIGKQVDIQSELDLAKEARFLSNLCVSLEANDILHLSNIWPFQWQVRKQLKKHKSRYYSEDNHYRVYRFRKVADTQSQMVLDLIMEAAKRSRANGELHDETRTGGKSMSSMRKPVVDQAGDFNPDEELRDERLDIERQRHELELAREDIESQMSAFRRDLETVSSQLRETPEPAVGAETAPAQPAHQPPFHKDPNAEDAKIIDPQRLRAAHTASTKRVQDTINANIPAAGIGVPVEELAALIRDEVTRQTGVQAEDAVAEPVQAEVSAEPVIEMEPLVVETSAPVRADERAAVASVESQASEAASEQSFEPLVAEAPLAAEVRDVRSDKPEAKAELTADDRRDHVNTDSIPFPASGDEDMPTFQAPANDVGFEPEDGFAGDAAFAAPEVELAVEPAVAEAQDEAAAPVDEPRQDEPVEAPAKRSAHNEAIHQNLKGRLQKLNEQAIAGDRGRKAAVYEDIDKAATENQAEQQPAGRLDDSQPPLVEAVRMDSANDLNQDPADLPAWQEQPQPEADSESVFDLPSEADEFEEGALPRFLTKDAVMDDITEENRARKMAERFSPNTKERD